MGNRALGYDFRPPSSGRNDPESKWESLEYKLMVEGVRKTLNDIDPESKWESLEYKLMVEGVRKTLNDIGKIVPGYKGQGYEIAGFVWWQGHKDSFVPGLIDEYEQNLVNP